MKKIKVRTDGKAVMYCKQIIFAVSLGFIALLGLVIYGVDLKLDPMSYALLHVMFLSSSTVFILFVIALWLLSRFSPFKSCALRKKLFLFTRQFTTIKDDGAFKHSVEWRYTFKGEKLILELYSNGLVSDKAKLGRELAEYLRLKLIKFEDLDDKAIYTFGNSPKRLDGKKMLQNAKL